MGTSIVVTSGKGGTGKTACCAAVAEFLAAAGHRTLCVDCDCALRNLDITLGMSEAVLFDFMDVLEGRRTASDAVTPHPRIPGLYLLSAPAQLLPADIDPGPFVSLIGELKEDYDFVLLDSPAGIGPGFRLSALAADMAVIVATGDLGSLRDGQRTAMELRALGVPELRLLVNRVRPWSYKKLSRTVDDVIDTVGARLLGVISEDDSVYHAGNTQTPLSLYGAKRTYPQFQRVARRLAGEKVPLGKKF